MFTDDVPVKEVRAGVPRKDFVYIKENVLKGPESVWFGEPHKDFRNHPKKSALVGNCWTAVAVDATNRPIGVAFYEGGTSKRLPTMLVTSIAVDPRFDAATRAAIGSAIIQSIGTRFQTWSQGKGYITADIQKSATVAQDVLQSHGWRCLQTRNDWSTDRFVIFSGSENAQQEESDQEGR